MLLEITFQYPKWYYLICLALGGLYAFGLYWRDRRFFEASNRKTLLGVLSFLRFAVVSLAAFLLLAPLLKSKFSDQEKPVVVLVHDNSSSITTKWSTADSLRYHQALDGLREEIGSKFQLDNYVFGSEVVAGDTIDYSEKATDLSAVIANLYNLYTNQNVGAVIVASDGIFNKGSHPLYARLQLDAPIYTIGLGDTVQGKDLRISRTYFNKIVYLNDRFNVQLDVQGINASGEQAVLTASKVERNGSVRRLFNKPFDIGDDNFLLRESLVLDATEAGPQRYRFSLSRLDNEATYDNNSVDIFIDVLDSRKKVLILANSPHPDVSAIRQSLENNRNYEVTIGLARDFAEPISGFNLVVLHQLPSQRYPVTELTQAVGRGDVAGLYVLGRQSSIGLFNQAQDLVSVNGNSNNFSDAQGVVDRSFSSFTISQDFVNAVQKLPPLTSPFGEYKTSGGAPVLIKQRIGIVATDYPLIALGQSGSNRIGVIAGEGLWRWRLYDHLQNGNHKVFNELISKTAQFLSVKDDKRRFRVIIPKNVFNESEQVTFDAELYNESYELINEPDVRMLVTDDEGLEFPYQFSKAGRAYRLDAGRFAPGNYTFRAETAHSGKAYSFEGQFSVSPLQLEALQTTADHRLLFNLSRNTGGTFFLPTQLSTLADSIVSSDKIKPVIRESEQTRAFINLRWVFFILLALLAAEWFIRKWQGAY